jgi:hypothetical protein
MKIIETQALGGYVASQVKGVELDGLTDAATLAGNLGAYAQDAVEHPPITSLFNELKSEKGFGSPFIAPSKSSLAAEALTLQWQLLSQIASGAIGEGEFAFRAIDEHAGRVLRAAVELPEHVVASAAERPATRFPKPSLRSIMDSLFDGKGYRGQFDGEVSPLHKKYNKTIPEEIILEYSNYISYKDKSL